MASSFFFFSIHYRVNCFSSLPHPHHPSHAHIHTHVHARGAARAAPAHSACCHRAAVSHETMQGHPPGPGHPGGIASEGGAGQRRPGSGQSNWHMFVHLFLLEYIISRWWLPVPLLPGYAPPPFACWNCPVLGTPNKNTMLLWGGGGMGPTT